ncbi:twin-arginine translocase subunit TatC [Neisseria montereyensis]|uniref:Sec-independent protein translocase protein TatC n=1 Tax=Neisseria montereyensis TaxID=2973938 RepID=A0ABT2FBW5_9NEIS|nr:twin-arginine translocase subunit TatC [Neisseria montereyensis]
MSESEQQYSQPLVEHLIELRRRLMWLILGVLICFLGLMPFSQQLYTFVANPLMATLPANTSMIATDVVAPFFVPVKVTLMVAFLLSLPHTLYQVWAFVAPALYQNEKRLITPLVLSSVILFFTGMAFAYFLVFPIIFKFLAGVTPVGVNMATDIDKYLSFVLGMFVAFGTTFEVPVVVVLLNRMGVVSPEQLKVARPYVIVGAFVIAAVITPPDIISQIMLAVPLILLYEAGLSLCRFMKPADRDDED